MEDKKNTKLLVFFFRACPIIVPTSDDENKPSVLGLGANYVYAADFDNNPELRLENTDERVCRKGLWYVGKRKYSYIGINDFIVDDDYKYGFGAVLSRERPRFPFKDYSRRKGFMWPVRVTPSNLIWLNPYQDVRVHKGKLYIGVSIVGQTYDPRLLELGREWQTNGELPQEVRELFENPIEKSDKLMAIIGRQTYKVSGNKRVSREIKDLYKKIRERNKRLLERGISASELEKAVSLTAEFLEDEHPEAEVDKVVSAIAQVAYEIREKYPKKGREVRHGLVHPQAYRKLEKLASERANPVIVEKIIDRHINWYDGEYTNFTMALVKAGVLARKSLIPSSDYKLIGEIRIKQWLTEGRKPYSPEFDMMMKIMYHFLSRRRFTTEVNSWLERHDKQKINWAELETEIPNKKGLF